MSGRLETDQDLSQQLHLSAMQANQTADGGKAGAKQARWTALIEQVHQGLTSQATGSSAQRSANPNVSALPDKISP